MGGVVGSAMTSCAAERAAAIAAQPTTFHRRVLPSPAVEFSSMEGQRMFGEALAAGTLGGFFRLIEQFRTQDEPAFCGLGTLTMVLNALNVDPGKTWKGPWRWFHEEMLDCCEPLDVVKEKGITWPKWICLAKCNGAVVEARRAGEAGGGLEVFREFVRRSSCQVIGCVREEAESLKVLVVSYSRKQFGQTGDGHYSPLGGYHEPSDSVLILDVARFKHPPHWVPLAAMHAAMTRVDPDTGRSRGFAMMTKTRACGCWLSLALRYCGCYGVQSAATVETAFVEAMVGASTAAEVVQRAVKFCEGPHMPLTVHCHPARPKEATAAPTGRTEAEAKALSEMRASLRCFVAQLQEKLGDCGLEVPTTEAGASAELSRAEQRCALLLAVGLELWPRLLGAESAAWASLQPLLEIEALPQALRLEVTTLRAQLSELIASSKEEEEEEIAEPAKCNEEQDKACCSQRGPCKP